MSKFAVRDSRNGNIIAEFRSEYRAEEAMDEYIADDPGLAEHLAIDRVRGKMASATAARGEAVRVLIARHREEYDKLHEEMRAKYGLDLLPRKKIADLEDEIQHLKELLFIQGDGA